MKRISTYFNHCIVIFILTLFCSKLIAQPCGTLTITGSSVSPATCPSSGSISVTATGTGLTYQLISGPAGYATASNTTGLFGTLTAGTYIVEVRDACGVKATVTKIVVNSYPAFSVSGVNTSNVCTSGVSGGSINATITGGRAPYQYDIVPVGNSPVYGATTASTSYSEVVSTFGTYRVYAKDACAEVRTYDIMVQPTQPLPTYMWWEDLVLDRPCGETMDGLPTISWKLHLLDQNGTVVGFNNLLGSTYQIYKPSVANSIANSEENCTTPLGALLTSGTIVSGNIPVGDTATYPVTIPQEDVILVFTTKCGQVYKYCYNFNQGNPATPYAEYRFIQQSCAASWNNQDISIMNKYVRNMTAPYAFLLTKSNTTTISNATGIFTGLKPADFPLTIQVTDACGRTVTKNFTMPVQGSALQVTAGPEWSLSCTTAKNTATAEIVVSGGDLQGIGDATNVVITGGTVTAVPTISPYNDWIPGYTASNLLAGYTYTVEVTNLCGEKKTVQFTVPADHWQQNTLNWNLTATTNALCGQNKSTINANSGYTGYNIVTYKLYDLTNPNTVIASNTTGTFDNVAPGNYKVKFVVPSPSSPCPGLDVKDSMNVTILNDGGSQTITRKTITTCEISGVPTTSGKAIIEVSGSAPFTYEIINAALIGTGAEVWTVSSTNNPSNTYTWDIPLLGDPSSTVYVLRTTDKCGNKVTTQASLQPINAPVVEAQNNPCIGSMNYTLTVNPYGGSFTYRWVKLPDDVTTLSAQNTITFPGAYGAVNDGTYRCYVSLAGCVERSVDVKVNSADCNQPLPVKLVSFTGSYNKPVVTLQWISGNEINAKQYEVERSENGIDFVKMNTVAAKNNGLAVSEYSTADNLSSYNGNVIYYRLKMVDRDGRFSYSSVIRLNVNDTRSGLSIYPNPARNDLSVSFISQVVGQALVKIIDKAGRVVLTNPIQVFKGSNTVKLPDFITGLPTGTYILEVKTLAGTQNAKFVKL